VSNDSINRRVNALVSCRNSFIKADYIQVAGLYRRFSISPRQRRWSTSGKTKEYFDIQQHFARQHIAAAAVVIINVDVMQNGSLLEQHHWRTTLSVLHQSRLFQHVDKHTWSAHVSSYLVSSLSTTIISSFFLSRNSSKSNLFADADDSRVSIEIVRSTFTFTFTCTTITCTTT